MRLCRHQVEKCGNWMRSDTEPNSRQGSPECFSIVPINNKYAFLANALNHKEKKIKPQRKHVEENEKKMSSNDDHQVNTRVLQYNNRKHD